MELNLTKRFFVYGTLRPSIKADWSDIVHENDKFKLTYFKAKLFGAKLYYMPDKGYPSIKLTNDNNDFVIGDIIESSNFKETLRIFDQIESYPTEYNRIEIDNCFNLEKNEFQKVFTYYFNRLHFTKIKNLDLTKFEEVISGDYTEFINNKLK